MRKPLDRAFRRDLLKLLCFVAAILAAGLLFIGTPALTLPTLLSIVIVTLFSPWITSLERKGFSRNMAILIVFGGLALVSVGSGYFVAKNWEHEWIELQENAPTYFTTTVQKLSVLEDKLKASYPFLKNIRFSEKLSARGSNFGAWFLEKIPAFAGDLVSCVFLVPILTFCLLSEGRAIRRRFFQLVPNRFFESVYIVTHGVSSALSDYLRAKLIEAFLVGLITASGLALIQSPYAIVLGIWAGATNIVPYIGPILGAIPGILIVALDANNKEMIWATISVYGIANLIDTVVIFPGIVAKLVNLNPLVLIASVVIGQYYYGIMGMLISIPIAAVIKVVLYEFYVIIYGYTPDHEQ